jgi:hypothetical protein
MRRLLPCVLLASAALGAGAQSPRVGVDRRVELLAILFRLAIGLTRAVAYFDSLPGRVVAPLR